MELINKKENIFGDDIAFVEQYDFSTANMSEENRIKAITTVASICYQNPKAIGSESLYNRLLAESKGLPSSSFEMCPILLTEEEFNLNVEKMKEHNLKLNEEKKQELLEKKSKKEEIEKNRIEALLNDFENNYLRNL